MSNRLGSDGEEIAASFLKKKGYKILAQNWRYGHLEIDIISQHDNFLVIVEVKTRDSDTFGHPSQFVNSKKHNNLYKATEEYIELTNYQGEVRFDIISIYQKGNSWKIEHYEDAFYPY